MIIECKHGERCYKSSRRRRSTCPSHWHIAVLRSVSSIVLFIPIGLRFTHSLFHRRGFIGATNIFTDGNQSFIFHHLAIFIAVFGNNNTDTGTVDDLDRPHLGFSGGGTCRKRSKLGNRHVYLNMNLSFYVLSFFINNSYKIDAISLKNNRPITLENHVRNKRIRDI